ncbi:hypothetical protein HRbin36_02461 [bacterium HR36]|nr:hypothetical protein HRbin36_02461 [bacterium HR36]
MPRQLFATTVVQEKLLRGFLFAQQNGTVHPAILDYEFAATPGLRICLHKNLRFRIAGFDVPHGRQVNVNDLQSRRQLAPWITGLRILAAEDVRQHFRLFIDGFH